MSTWPAADRLARPRPATGRAPVPAAETPPERGPPSPGARPLHHRRWEAAATHPAVLRTPPSRQATLRLRPPPAIATRLRGRAPSDRGVGSLAARTHPRFRTRPAAP